VRFAAALLVVLVVLVPARASRAADPPPLRAALRTAQGQVDWTNLTRRERLRVLSRWARAPAMLDALLDRVAPQLAVHRSLATEIAQGNFTDMSIGGSGPAWRVNLSPEVLDSGSKLSAHLTLHELGHVVDGVLGTDAWREALFAAFARSPRWQACWPMPLGSSSRCVRSNEIIADEFAFWATGRRGVRSSYGVPPLLRRAELGAWFARLLPPWQRSPSGWTVPGSAGSPREPRRHARPALDRVG
jgi:hypothetical protein